MFLAKVKRWLHKPRVRTVPLEALAVLWTHADGAQALLEKEDNDEVRWVNQEINDFYRSYVSPYSATLGQAKKVIEQILSLLDLQGNHPSVEDPDDVLSQVTLREHALNVARQAIDTIKRHHKDHEMIAPRILIIALGHDLGVTGTGDILGGANIKSLLILEPMIQDLPYKETIFDAIRSYKENNPKSQEARILRAAEAAARKKELQRIELLSATPGVPLTDIKKISAVIENHNDSGKSS